MPLVRSPGKPYADPHEADRLHRAGQLDGESFMSNRIAPIQEPVTGGEEIVDPSQPRGALTQFYRALNGRDLALMEQNWANSPEAAMDNPLGGIKRGWPEIRSIYERLFETPWSYAFEFWDYTEHCAADVYWVVGRERGHLARNNDRLDLAIRTTRLFRRVGDRWRQVHHHGSIDDSRMLSSYVSVIRQSIPSAQPNMSPRTALGGEFE